MKILVTGGGGYIGSVLVPYLLNHGYEVVVLDKFYFGEDKLNINSDKLKIIKDDIRFFKKEILEDIDTIVDLAALSNDPTGELDPIKTWSINYLGRYRVATLGKLMGVKKYILASSCSVYGFQNEIVKEDSPTNPLTTYAKANLKAEEDILPYANDNFTVVILRFATVYGFSPRMRFDLAINGMVKGFFKNGKIPILRDGTQYRPFVHVKDVCKAIMLTIEASKDLVNKQIFNVGSNEQNYQIFKLAQEVAEAIGIPFKYEWYGFPDHRSYRVDFSKIQKILKFKPDYTPRDGAIEVWEALKSGKVDPDDPQTITVNWYKKLLEDGVMV
ncbi:MAG: SDR family NAD-dependent epimerase/dehydratase [Thermodesulfobacteriota bacterium]|nr:MAG: SDR family NAD-dependent epimerase/dehydratase [Thermodesulfobacteriota bacterium]